MDDKLHREINKLCEELNKIMEIEMQKLFTQDIDTATTATSAINHNKPLSLEQINSLKEQMKPYNDYMLNQYLYSVPAIRIDSNRDDENKFRLLPSYGHRIMMPTKVIITKVQKRINKNKRINKKWLKKYGYKEIKKKVLDYGFITNSGV